MSPLSFFCCRSYRPIHQSIVLHQPGFCAGSCLFPDDALHISTSVYSSGWQLHAMGRALPTHRTVKVPMSRFSWFHFAGICWRLHLKLYFICVPRRLSLDDPWGLMRQLCPDVGVCMVALVTMVLCSQITKKIELLAASNITSVSCRYKRLINKWKLFLLATSPAHTGPCSR